MNKSYISEEIIGLRGRRDTKISEQVLADSI